MQLVEWFELGNKRWSKPTMLFERTHLVLCGLLGNLTAPVAVVKTFGKPGGKRGPAIAFGMALSLPMATVAAFLLLKADDYFAFVVGRVIEELGRLFGDVAVRLVLGLLIMPALFGLAYALRHGKRKEETIHTVLPTMDALILAITLGVMDLLYAFFLLVQSTVLFGGPEYVERVAGLSYAEYARSGFFQLVFVALLNLILILTALQFSEQSGKPWRSVQILCTLMTAMSCVILASAAYRMTLYVQVYGLSFKRFLTYWGMVMLSIFFLAAAIKVWREGFSFFKVLLSVSIMGWLVLNACNVDRIVANYNVDLFLRQEIATIDLNYVVNELSYDALDVLESVVFEYQMQNPLLEATIKARRQQAREEVSHWQTWNLSAYLAAGEI